MESNDDNYLTENELKNTKETVNTSNCSKFDCSVNYLKETEPFIESDNIGSDVKSKISKLEAYSRQLCLNLKNLQKNRAELINEAAVLSEELEVAQEDIDKDLISSDSNVHILLDVKQDLERNYAQEIVNVCSSELMKCESCINCTCVECESNVKIEDDRFTIFHEFLKKKTMFHQENDCRYPYYGNNPESVEYLCERCTEPNPISVSSVTTTVAFASNEEKEITTSTNQAKSSFRCTCKSEETCMKFYGTSEQVNDGSKSKTSCCIDNTTEERCRGGFDHDEGRRERKKAVNAPVVGNESKRKICEGCQCNLCTLRNVEGSLLPCLTSCNSFERLNDKNDTPASLLSDEGNCDNLAALSVDPPMKLQRMCKVEQMREVLEQLKNRNHALKKMIANDDCNPECSTSEDANFFTTKSKNNQKNDEIGRTTSELILTVKDLQEKCRIKDGMIMTLVETLKRDSSSERTERILANLANVDEINNFQSRDFDRSELRKYLQGNSQSHIRHERVSVNDKTSKPDLIAGLIALFLITFSHFYHCHEYSFSSSVSLYFKIGLDCVHCILDRVTNVILALYAFWIKFVTKPNQEFSVGSINETLLKSGTFTKYLSVISSYVTSVGALFGSLSFIRTLWTLGVKLFDWYQASSSFPPLDVPQWLNKFLKSIKKFTLFIIFYIKSQCYFISYLFCLTLGFLASKLSNVVNDKSEISQDIPDENVFD